MAITLVALAGVIIAHLTGLRMFQITKSKIGASEDARKAINLLSTEIRSAKIIRIGNRESGFFIQVPDGTIQQGNAIQVYPTTNLGSFVQYFSEVSTSAAGGASGRLLKRAVNGGDAVTVVANFVTNDLVFSSQDAFGNTITNNRNNRVIDMRLEFYQIQFPVVRIGPGNYYDYYKLSTKITRRVLE